MVHQTTDDAGLPAWLAEKPRTLYAGFDPTADSLHVGHLVALLMIVHAAAALDLVLFAGGGRRESGDGAPVLPCRSSSAARSLLATAVDCSRSGT
jgi:tyrosyl-tRNA synthetase